MILIMESHPSHLKDYLDKNRQNMDLSRVIKICHGIGKGLNFLFKEGVVHRDMKLDNILIDENGNFNYMYL